MPPDLSAVLAPYRGRRLGVAVSGGGDSMALLCLLAQQHDALWVVSINHGLRPEAAAEIELVAAFCAARGLPHHIAHWQGWDGTGNLQDAARRARQRLISDWAKREGISAVALGHTADDQAETVLMRLARGAGVDGLAAMAPARRAHGITWLRPLLDIPRAALRAYLTREGVHWAEDPSNEDARFDRVRMRRAFADLGMGAALLGQVAAHMRMAQSALEAQTDEALRHLAVTELGIVRLVSEGFMRLPGEIQRRALIRAVMWISNSDYAPRRAPLLAAIEAIRQGQSATLGGVQIARKRHETLIFREYSAVRGAACAPHMLWDGRWQAQGAARHAQIAPLGAEGLAQLPDHRATNLPRAALLSLPGVWDGARLLAAPVLSRDEKWRFDVDDGATTLFSSPYSH